MCGIHGLIKKTKTGGFSTYHQKMMYQMLMAGMVRGDDATGVVAVYKDGDFSIQKEATDGYIFNWAFKDKEVDKKLWQEGVAYIGHNRAKTIGENKDENAHPFVEDNTFAMVHNGTLRNHKQIGETDVDSHALAIHLKKAMDEEDWQKALEDALSKVVGAYACVWYDQKRDQICMVRNSERPLWLVHTDTAVLFGSEPGMLHWIASRNGDKIEKTEVVKTSTLYTFDMKKAGGDYSETFLLLSPQKTTSTGYNNGTAKHGNSTTTSGSKHKGFIDEKLPALSKAAFKRLSPKLMGKRLQFWVEDFVDIDTHPTKEMDHILVFAKCLNGQYDLCDVPHIIRFQIKLSHMGLTENDMYGDMLMSGEVFDTEYDKDDKAIIIRVRSVQEENVQALH